jgi:hypothetical protein
MAVLAARDGYEVDDDPARLDLDVIHGFLRTAYWSVGVPREVVARAISHSVNAGLYDAAGRQVGYARAATDRATFASPGVAAVDAGHRRCTRPVSVPRVRRS